MASSGSSSDDVVCAFLAAQGAAHEADAGARPAGPGEPGEPGERHAQLAGALVRAVEQAAAAWPGLTIDHTGFAGFLGQRIPSDVDPISALGDRRLDELYLAFGCLAGDPAALRLLDVHYLGELARVLREQGIADDVAADALQRTRMRLVTGERPILRSYSGVGALRGWLKITALRDAIRAQRKVRSDEPDDVAAALADAAADPALQYQRRRYEADFRIAFEAAIAALTVRERNLLKQSVLYGATIDDLGALYHVHRATVARWLTAARERLADTTRQRMIERLQIAPSEYDSIIELIHSQLDISVARLLG